MSRSSRYVRGALLALSLLLAAHAAWAAGSVAGVVLDARTGLPVRGATLTVEGTDVSIDADFNGVFAASLAAGTYTVLVAADGYETSRITDVVVTDGGTRNFSALLNPTGDAEGDGVGAIAETITVEAAADAATEAALLAERRSASQIVDNIGAEEISKNTGSDAAGAIKRVTGISLQEDKYVFVRGLGERYSNTTVNGSKVPTVEFDKKVVPLDMFAADLLEKVTVAKSYTVDQPGDFVAGVIELETKNFPPNQRFSIGISAADNSVTTGEPILEYPGGLSSSGSGGQALPSGFPDERLVRFNFFTQEGFTDEELEDFGEMLLGNWSAAPDDSASYNQGLKLSYGNSFDRFGLVLSGTWSDDHDSRQEIQNFYSSGSGGVLLRDNFTLDVGEETVKQSLMGNFAVRLGNNGQVSLRALQTGLSNSEARFQQGFLADAISDIEDTVLRYQDQEVTSYQMSGDHFLSDVSGSGSLFEWKGSISDAEVEENRREVLYEIDGDERFLSVLGNSGFLFYNDQTDELNDGRIDWTTMFSAERGFGSFKFGAAYTEGDRDFAARRFQIRQRFVRTLDLSLPPEELYIPENIGLLFQVREVTNATDGYTGTFDTTGFYGMGDFSRGRWRIIGGLRSEDWQEEIVTVSRQAVDDEPTITAVGEKDLLPSISMVYDLGNNQSLRASASRTVNRPDFRELAPFGFTQVLGGFNIVGNPELQRAEIDSFDLRWEWFPSGGEVLAASLFHKDFTDPIEAVIVPAVEDTQTFQNNGGATNQGFELEVRKRLGFLAEALDTVTAIVNYTFVDSEIEIDPSITLLTNPKRPLTGQPDNVVNVVLEWSPRTINSSVRLLYNFVDDKVFLGGVQGLPDILESARSTVDLTWAYSFPQGVSLKLSGTNLLDEEKEWTQADRVYRLYETGRTFGLSLGYSF